MSYALGELGGTKDGVVHSDSTEATALQTPEAGKSYTLQKILAEGGTLLFCTTIR